jgi:acyl carrier protein phosphodiesterase
MHGNLLGDFVKGHKWEIFPNPLKKGVLLHRSIDTFIDHHPAVRKLNKTLYTELPKVAGIAVDLFFDHLLARRWTDFHHLTLNDFLNNFYSYSSNYTNYFSAEYLHFLTQLRKHQWVNHYASQEGLYRLCQGVSKKLSFPNQLGQAYVSFEKNQPEIIETFDAYMHDAVPHFQKMLSDQQ